MLNLENNQEPKLLCINEASVYLNLRVSKLRAMIFKREIPLVKIGRLIRFEKSQLDQWLKQHRRN
jgi:excisionase family DNA binding protein